jgi:hypothetical protein
MNRPLHLPISLTDSQLSQVTAAAALLRVSARSQFLQDIASQLNRLRDLPTNSDVNNAIQICLGSVPITDIRSLANEQNTQTQTGR